MIASDFTCPPWCVADESHLLDDPGHLLHISELAGTGYRAWRNDTPDQVGAVELSYQGEINGLTTDGLRKLAIDALSAAEWLESIR